MILFSVSSFCQLSYIIIIPYSYEENSMYFPPIKRSNFWQALKNRSHALENKAKLLDKFELTNKNTDIFNSFKDFDFHEQRNLGQHTRTLGWVPHIWQSHTKLTWLCYSDNNRKSMQIGVEWQEKTKIKSMSSSE